MNVWLLRILAIPLAILFWGMADYIMTAPSKEYSEHLKKKEEAENVHNSKPDKDPR